MSKSQAIQLLLCGSAALTLGACGGGGGSVASTPPAPLTPTPTPSPTPTGPPPLPPGPIGLQTDGPFTTTAASVRSNGEVATGADLVQFSYSPSTDRYTITLPEFETGQLVTQGGIGLTHPVTNEWVNLISTYNQVTAASTSSVQAVSVSLPWPGSTTSPYTGYKYTAIGQWSKPDHYSHTGVFAYGIPTIAGDVPLSGSASYSGAVAGATVQHGLVGGSVSLAFDFGAGTLSGVMKPMVAPSWDSYPLGDYTFRDTVFAKGATSFSGAFAVPGSTAPSSFQGSFTGPQAAELMASWTAPFLNPENQKWETMFGVWIAKRQ